MNKWLYQLAMLGGLLVTATGSQAAYNSGSTGADGEFNPTSSQAVQLPPDGVFNYTSVNIPAGVTITYIKNANNTPVTILASGNVNIAGTIDVSASSVDATGGGIAGPGGYNGGASGTAVAKAAWLNGYSSPNVGRAGQGPGGGSPGMPKLSGGLYSTGYADVSNGGGGAFGTAPAAAHLSCPAVPGAVYGNEMLIPMEGGSGGGGGAGGVAINGTGGGGGGGALLIAASGTINVTGSLLAQGGIPASAYTLYGNSVLRGTSGGGGSGGAIRLIATQITGNGTISAAGGVPSNDSAPVYSNPNYYYICSNSYGYVSTYGGAGRIRLDADVVTRTTPTTPAWTRGAPTLAFVPGLPKLVITSIGGVNVPAGNSSIALPAGYSNPVTVNFATQSVTVGSQIKLTVTPAKGQAYSVTSAPTTGTNANASGSVDVTLNPGSNSLLASVTYTIVAALGDTMSVYAKGERVEKVNVATALGSSESVVTLITVTGKEYVVPAWVLRATHGQG